MRILILLTLAMLSLTCCVLAQDEPANTDETAKTAEACEGDSTDEESDEEKEEEPEVLTGKALRKLMGELDETNDDLRKAIKEEDDDKAEEHMERLEELAEDINRWGRKDAEGNERRNEGAFKKFYKAMQERVEELRQQVDSGDWKEAARAQKESDKACENCHNTYDSHW